MSLADDITGLVRKKISELGTGQAAEFFGVRPSELFDWNEGTVPVPLAAVERLFQPAVAARGRMTEANWEGKKVAILLPFQKSTNPLTLFSITSMIDRMKMATMMQYGDAFIVHTRNRLVAQFQKSGIEWSKWIDDDMIEPCGKAEWFRTVTDFADYPEEFAGVHTINRLLASGKTLIGTLYFGRNKRRRPMYGIKAGDVEEEAFAQSAPHDVVKQVPWCATGGLLAHKSVYSDMQAGFPELAPQMKDDTWHLFSNSETELTHAVDEAMVILNDAGTTEGARVAKVQALLLRAKMEVAQKRLRFGEDVTFCRRAAKVGHPAHVDFGIVSGHVGSYVYGPKRFALV